MGARGRTRGRWGLAALLALGLASLSHAEEVTVFAAASLTDALQEAGRAWEASTGNRLAFNLGASSDLARQILAGAPADVFFSADEAQVTVLEKAGLVGAGEKAAVLSNVLVVVVPAASSARVGRPEDLLALRRIALADPDAVPAGVYARRYLEAAGVWARLRERVIPALNVRAALAAVESADVDAGIVYRTDAALSRGVRVAFEVPAERGPRIVYVLAPLAAARQAAARDLTRFLASPAATAIYRKHGFLVLSER